MAVCQARVIAPSGAALVAAMPSAGNCASRPTPPFSTRLLVVTIERNDLRFSYPMTSSLRCRSFSGGHCDWMMGKRGAGLAMRVSNRSAANHQIGAARSEQGHPSKGTPAASRRTWEILPATAFGPLLCLQAKSSTPRRAPRAPWPPSSPCCGVTSSTLLMMCDTLLVQPNVCQVLVQIVARRDLPALHVRAHRHDAVPECHRQLMRLVVDALLQLAHPHARLVDIGLLQHPVVDVDHLRIGEETVVLTINLVRQPAADIGNRVDDVLAVGLQRHVELTTAHTVEPWACRNHLLGRLDADLAPFIDQPGTNNLVGLVHVAIEELERQVLLTRLFQ